jgi:hypothetical protein
MSDVNKLLMVADFWGCSAFLERASKPLATTGWWAKMLFEGQAEAIKDMLNKAAWVPYFPLTFKVPLSKWTSTLFRSVVPALKTASVPQLHISESHDRMHPSSFLLWDVDCGADIETVRAFGDLYAQQFHFIGDRLGSKSFYEEFIQTPAAARLAWGSEDPRFLLLRTYGPLGQMNDMNDVARYILEVMEESTEGDSREEDLDDRDPLV